MLPLRYLRVLVALAGVVTVFLAVPTPAQASVSGSTATTDVMLDNECQLHRVDYSINVTSDTYYWQLELQLFDPDGLTYTSAVFTKTASPTHGSAEFQFCGSETPGTWTVRSSGFYETLPGYQINYTLPDTTFKVDLAPTRTGLRSRALRHHRYRMTVTVLDQRPGGFARTDGATVQLQQLTGGAWRAVRRTRTQADHGRVSIRIRARHGTRIRAVTTGLGYYAGSISRTVRLR